MPSSKEPSRPSANNAQNVVDRRLGLDRRDAPDGRNSCLKRRRGPGRRRSDFVRSAEEGEMTKEQYLFLRAIEAFKTANGKPFPAWTDVLEVIRRLGYRKTQPSQVDLGGRAVDWTERPDASANVDVASNLEDAA